MAPSYLFPADATGGACPGDSACARSVRDAGKAHAMDQAGPRRLPGLGNETEIQRRLGGKYDDATTRAPHLAWPSALVRLMWEDS